MMRSILYMTASPACAAFLYWVLVEVVTEVGKSLYRSCDTWRLEKGKDRGDRGTIELDSTQDLGEVHPRVSGRVELAAELLGE